MKFFAYLAAAAGLAVTPISANAAEWWIVGDNEETIYLVDATSISVTGDMRTAWLRWEAIKTSGPNQYLLIRTRHDCSERSYFVFEIISYDKSGNVAGRSKLNETTYPPPDSTLMQSLNFVCAYDRKLANAGKLEGFKLPPTISPTAMAEQAAKNPRKTR